MASPMFFSSMFMWNVSSNTPMRGEAGWNTFGACGDGLEVLINYLDQDIVYTCSQFGFCSREPATAITVS